MSRKIWTTQGIVIVTIIVVMIIAFLAFGGYEAISKIVKEFNINNLVEPNNEQ